MHDEEYYKAFIWCLSSLQVLALSAVEFREVHKTMRVRIRGRMLGRGHSDLLCSFSSLVF